MSRERIYSKRSRAVTTAYYYFPASLLQLLMQCNLTGWDRLLLHPFHFTAYNDFLGQSEGKLQSKGEEYVNT